METGAKEPTPATAEKQRSRNEHARKGDRRASTPRTHRAAQYHPCTSGEEQAVDDGRGRGRWIHGDVGHYVGFVGVNGPTPWQFQFPFNR